MNAGVPQDGAPAVLFMAALAPARGLLTRVQAFVVPPMCAAILMGALSRAEQGKKPDFETVITRALEAERDGRLDEARDAFREAARLKPDHPRVHYSLAWLLFQRGSLTEALAAVDRALALDGNQALFHLLRGTIFHSLANRAEAERDYQSAIRLDPSSGEAYLALADLYLSGEQLEKSAQALRSYLDLNPEDTQALYFLGGVLSDQNRREEALEILDRVIQAEPGHARAWFQKAHLEAQERGTMEKALVSYQKSLDLDPSYAYALYEYGTLLGKLGHTEEAIAALRKACDLEPELSEASYALGNLLSREGRTEEAQAFLELFKVHRDRKARRTERQRRAVAALGTGRKMLEENRLEEAVEAFLEMTELDPTSHQGYAFLAKTYASLGQIDVAMAYVRRAMELGPGASEYPYLLSLFLREKGDLGGALAYARRALSLSPQNALLHNALGVILSDMGDENQALLAFKRAAELDPENPAYTLNLAAAYEKLGQAEKSAGAMERYRRQLAAEPR
ncbi:MAG: tetratricopeptide repeat protein [Acidobacteriota bacterium]